MAVDDKKVMAYVNGLAKMLDLRDKGDKTSPEYQETAKGVAKLHLELTPEERERAVGMQPSIWQN